MDQAPELLVIGQFNPHFLEVVFLDVIGRLFAVIDVVELVVGAVPSGILGLGNDSQPCDRPCIAGKRSSDALARGLGVGV
jgi:hypothetical protein